MQAQQANVSNIANNLSNVNTNGFKRGGVQFSEIIQSNGSQFVQNSSSGRDLRGISGPEGMGVKVDGVRRSFDSGDLKQTDRSLDMAVRGEGFFEITLPDGSVAYTRNGSFNINKDGMLAAIDGNPLKQSIEVSSTATGLVVDAKGLVYVQMPDEKELTEIGQIQLAVFRNPEGLKAIGQGLYLATDESGEAESLSPEDAGVGSVAQGYLEASNVQLADEMVNLVLAQRAYELNSKVLQVADEMLAIGNNLRR